MINRIFVSLLYKVTCSLSLITIPFSKRKFLSIKAENEEIIKKKKFRHTNLSLQTLDSPLYKGVLSKMIVQRRSCLKGEPMCRYQGV